MCFEENIIDEINLYINWLGGWAFHIIELYRRMVWVYVERRVGGMMLIYYAHSTLRISVLLDQDRHFLVPMFSVSKDAAIGGGKKHVYNSESIAVELVELAELVELVEPCLLALRVRFIAGTAKQGSEQYGGECMWISVGGHPVFLKTSSFRINGCSHTPLARVSFRFLHHSFCFTFRIYFKGTKINEFVKITSYVQNIYIYIDMLEKCSVCCMRITRFYLPSNMFILGYICFVRTIFSASNPSHISSIFWHLLHFLQYNYILLHVHSIKNTPRC